MRREHDVYLRDIIEATAKIEKYTLNLSYDEFLDNDLIQDGVIRNLEIIGEAVKKIPMEVRLKNSHIEWRKIAGLRDFLIHAYFEIDLDLVWDVVVNKIPILKREITSLLEE